MRSYRTQEAYRILGEALFPSLACMAAYPFALVFLSAFIDLSPDPLGIPRELAALLFPAGALVLAFATFIPEPDFGHQASMAENLANALYNAFAGGIVWSFVWGILFGIGAMPKAFLVAGAIYGGFCLALIAINVIIQGLEEFAEIAKAVRGNLYGQDRTDPR